MERCRIKDKAPFEVRLANEARRLREQAKTLPYGLERDALIRRARQAETASKIDAWLSSPGLAPPK